MRRALTTCALALVCAWTSCWTGSAAAQDKAANTTVVLDTVGMWRMFHVLKPPEIAFDDEVRQATFKQYWLNRESAPPPTNWTKREFDDSHWLRGPALMSAKTPFVARACFRGKFRVTDSAKTQKLVLTVDYHGGVVVYVNGQEVKRSHVPAGTTPQLADAYPEEAFLGPDGVLLAKSGSMVMIKDKMIRVTGKPTDEEARRWALQKRTLEVDIPPSKLRQGVNVVAVEVIRAPYHQVIDAQKTMSNGGIKYDMHWNTCELLGLRLAAANGAGLEPNAARAEGFQLWNAATTRTDFALDFGDRCEPLRPISIVGTRNGTFSGKVVAGSSKPIRGLKATMSELSCPGGTIPADNVRVRYGGADGTEFGVYENMYGYGKAENWPRAVTALGVLYDEAATTIPVGSTFYRRTADPKVPPGAVAPIWVTVTVPADANAGTYEGTLTVTAEGESPVTVPVSLQVLDWRLPRPHDFRTWIELIQSPDTLQVEYGVPLWSQRHWELIGRSMRFLREVGSGMLYVPLLAETNNGNAESFVRWIKKDDGGYDWDFSVMDRYLDVAVENMGQPKAVCFIVWEVYLHSTGSRSHGGTGSGPGREVNPIVTMLDPATKQVHNERIPNYDDPAMKAVWTELFRQLRTKLKARGLEDAMMVGCMHDLKPTKDEVLFWREVTGDLPWVSHSHGRASNPKSYGNTAAGSGFKTGYETSIYEVFFSDDPAVKRSYGWKKPILHAQNTRTPPLGSVPAAFSRQMGEINITGNQRGFGRLGADYWDAIKDKSGRRKGKVYQRFPKASWMNLELANSYLAPGPDGAVATNRFEMLREGVQECEARIFIETALTDPKLKAKLGEELAQRAQAELDERTLYVQRAVADFKVNCWQYHTPWNWSWQSTVNGNLWYQSSGWQQRSATLYALAGEVQKRLAAR